MKQYSFISTVFVLLFLITGCDQKPTIDMSEALGKSRETLKELDEIDTVAAAYTGESDIKFRLMVEEQPTEKETVILFNKIIESIVQYSNHSDVWDYYDGYFDIKSYDHGVIYEATKLISKDLDIVFKP